MVGAGLAALACALRLQDYGVRVRVLEARGLVGGRASRGGADWVHGQHVTTWKYLKRFNMQTDGSANGWASNVPGGPECWVYVDGQLRGPDKVHTEPNRLFFDRFAEAVEEWIEAGREDVSMQALADRVFEHPPTDEERRLMEGMMAEWHAADLADVGVYEDDLYSDRIQALAKARPSLLDEDGDEGALEDRGWASGLGGKDGKRLRLEFIDGRPQGKLGWRQGVHGVSGLRGFFCSTCGCASPESPKPFQCNASSGYIKPMP